MIQRLTMHLPMQGTQVRSRMIPQATKQLSPHATAAEACSPRARARYPERTPQQEAQALQPKKEKTHKATDTCREVGVQASRKGALDPDDEKDLVLTQQFHPWEQTP